MRGVLVLLVGVLLGVLVLGVGTAAVFEFPRAPLREHSWAPVPAACAGPSCITYAQWNRATRVTGERSPADVLTALIEERAVLTVSRREGVRVSEGEIDQALTAITGSLEGTPGGPQIVRDLYGENPEEVLRPGLRTLLLREKLRAVGLSSPWESRFAPVVTVWNIHLRWGAERHVVVNRPSSAVAGEAAR